MLRLLKQVTFGEEQRTLASPPTPFSDMGNVLAWQDFLSEDLEGREAGGGRGKKYCAAETLSSTSWQVGRQNAPGEEGRSTRCKGTGKKECAATAALHTTLTLPAGKKNAPSPPQGPRLAFSFPQLGEQGGLPVSKAVTQVVAVCQDKYGTALPCMVCMVFYLTVGRDRRGGGREEGVKGRLRIDSTPHPNSFLDHTWHLLFRQHDASAKAKNA